MDNIFRSVNFRRGCSSQSLNVIIMVDLRYLLTGPASSLVNATIIGIVVCCVLVSNRIYWRAKTIVGLDDYLILLSLVRKNTAWAESHSYY